MENRPTIEIDLADQMPYNSPKVIPIWDDDDEGYVKILDSVQKSLSPSLNDLNLSYTNSESNYSRDLKSEYVNIEENNNQDNQLESSDSTQSMKEIAQEKNYLIVGSPFEWDPQSSRINKDKANNTDDS